MKTLQLFRYILIFSSVLSLILFLRQNNIPDSISNQLRSLAKLKVKYCTNQGIQITETSIVDQSQRDHYEKTMSNLQILRPGENQMQKAIDEKKWADYGISLVPIAAPWLILMIISLLGWICYCCCCSCDKCCPPSKCCRRDIRKPLTKCEKGWPIIGILIFGTMMLCCTIVGFVFTSRITKGLKTMQCAVVNVVEDFNYGASVNGNDWIGITPGLTQITSLIDQLDSTINSINAAIPNPNFLDADKTDLLNTNELIYTNYKTKQLQSPKPSDANKDSVFSTTQLGPPTEQNKYTYVFKQYFEITGFAIANLLKTMGSVSQSINSQSATFKTALNDGKLKIVDFKDQITNIENKLDDNLEQINNGIDNMKTIFLIYYTFLMVLAIITLAAIILIFFFNWRKFRYFLHIAWCFMSLFMLLGFLLSTIMAPVSVALLEGCGVMKNFLSSEANMVKSGLIDQNSAEKISICYFGNGKIAEKLGLTTQLDEISKITSSFTQITNYTDPSNPQYINLNDQSNKVFDAQKIIIKNYEDGKIVDFTDPNIWNYPSLEGRCLTDSSYDTNCQANKLITAACKGANAPKDVYVYTSADCPSGYTLLTGASTSNIPNPTCITLGQLSGADVTARLGATSLSGTCTTNYKAQTDQYKLANDDRVNYYKYSSATAGVGKSVDELYQKNSAFNTKTTNAINNLAGITTQLDAFTKSVSGIVNQFNCKFLGANIDKMFEAFCIAFMPPIYDLMVIIIITSIGMFFNSFCSFKAAMNYSRKNVYGNNGLNQTNSTTQSKQPFNQDLEYTGKQE